MTTETDTRRFLTATDRADLYALVADITQTAQAIGLTQDTMSALAEEDRAYQAFVQWVAAHSEDGCP